MSAPSTTLERGQWIGWRADATGYQINVYDSGGNMIAEYFGGNSKLVSGISIDPMSQDALPFATIQRYAKQTAQDMAAEYGVDLVMIVEEED